MEAARKTHKTKNMQIEPKEINIKEDNIKAKVFPGITAFAVFNTPIKLELTVNGKSLSANGKLRDLFNLESNLIKDTSLCLNINPYRLKNICMKELRKNNNLKKWLPNKSKA